MYRRDPSLDAKAPRLPPTRRCVSLLSSRIAAPTADALSLQKASGKNAQKAFRERRQEYVSELEEKVRRLEAGEGEKCVFYQQQAQKAKVESQQLREENVALKREIEALRSELARAREGATARAGGQGGDKGKARAAPNDFDDTTTKAKRPRRTAAVRAKAVVASATSSSPPQPAAVGTHSPISSTSPEGTSTSYDAPAAVFFSPSTGIQSAPPVALPQRCTFCSGDANCFCAEVGYEVAPSSATAAMQIVEMAAAAAVSPSLVEEEPDDLAFNDLEYEPAVPLKLRRSQNKPSTPVWAIESSSSRSNSVVAASSVVCSGDPTNCPACSDDPCVRALS